MNTKKEEWVVRWLDSVANGSYTVNQRKLSVVNEKGGGLTKLRREARARRVHLVVLTDDKGTKIVAASRHSFKVIC